MKTHDRERLDDRTLDGGKQSAKTPKPRPAKVEQSILDLQATVGNRAVGDLMAGSGPVLQGSFFGGPFGGLEEWLGEESPGGSSSFDASSKAEVADASMKEAPSDNSMKVAYGSDKWDASQKVDASDKWDASEKLDASDKWDASEKLDASDKWDASAKSELGLASKDDELGSELEFEEY
ncbi:MAG TPA: hypothetical protein VF990_13795 [Candidatus Dormibacteraeota bacterium]